MSLLGVLGGGSSESSSTSTVETSTEITDDRDVLTGSGVLAGNRAAIGDRPISLSVRGRNSPVSITSADPDVAKAAIDANSAALQAVLAGTAAERAADQALLSAALTPEQRAGADTLKAIQIIAALAAGAWVLTTWAGR